MRKTVHKVFGIWSFDKEEKWLNEMAAKGWALISVGFCSYEFEECLPGEYTIRLEFLDNRIHSAESQRYIEFVETTGVEQVGSYWKWIYFRKRKADGDFELFSDNASRIKHLSKIIRLLVILGSFNLFVGCYNLGLYFLHSSSMNACGILNLFVGLLCVFGFIRLFKKRKKLKEDQRLFE